MNKKLYGFLLEQNIFESYMRNTVKYQRNHNKAIISHFDRSFSWMYSPEGFAYWARLNAQTPRISTDDEIIKFDYQ